MMTSSPISSFRRIGRDLFLSGLVTSHGGNMSLRLGDSILITRHGAMLGRLGRDDLVEASLEGVQAAASMDLAVHQAIYRVTSAQAIVHAHPVHTIALSLVERSILPAEAEGQHFLGEVPVVGQEPTAVLAPLAEEIAAALKGRCIVMARGHGSFAVGESLEQAYQWTSALEASCRVAWLLRSWAANNKGGHPSR